MKNAKISRRSFLLGLAACSAAGVLTACKGTDAPSGSTASFVVEQPASSAASSAVQQPEPFLTVEEFPPLDGSTACIPLMAQMLADTTGMDLEEARSSITVSTTAYAWENFGLYDTTTRMLVVYEAPDYVKEELQEANVQLEQKPIGVDALVFIVNGDNPVQALTQQQLRDIYAGKITNWKDVGGKDQEIVAFQRGEDSGSQTLFKKLLIQGGELMTPPSELTPAAMGELVDSIADYNNSANAIGFSVYYYIDQMYSKPGLRLLAVDGVTPSNDTLADGSYPPVQRFLRRHPPGCRRRQPGAPPVRLAGHRRRAGLHQKVRLCGRWPADHRHHRGLKLTDLLSSATIKAGFCRSLCSSMPKGRSYYGTSLSPGRKPLAHLPAQPHYSGFQPAGSAVIRAGADRPAAQRCASDPLDARPAVRWQRGRDPHLSGAQLGHCDRH